jgi:hypothetical protein
MPLKSKSFIHQHQFWIFLFVALILRQIPFISLPFNWLESYFHEISHGLMAIVTGGKIMTIELFTNGAGLCTSRGGSRFLISFSGYAGAVFWGSLLYLMATAHQKLAQFISLSIFILIALSIIFWVRDLLTLIICIVLLGVFALLLKNKWLHHSQWLLKLISMTVLLNAITSPFYLFDGRSIGDGATLASLTGLPEFIWVIVWSLLGISALYLLRKKS